MHKMQRELLECTLSDQKLNIDCYTWDITYEPFGNHKPKACYRSMRSRDRNLSITLRKAIKPQERRTREGERTENYKNSQITTK